MCRMRKDRQVFEQKIREYKERARNALETVNHMTELFASYGAPFNVWRKENFKRNFEDGYISTKLGNKLKRHMKKGVCGENLRRYKHRYGLIEKSLMCQVDPARKAYKEFGRVMDYDPETYIFKLNNDKLDRAALRHADDPEK